MTRDDVVKKIENKMENKLRHHHRRRLLLQCCGAAGRCFLRGADPQWSC